MVKNQHHSIFFILFALFMAMSCVPNKKLAYVQTDEDDERPEEERYYVGEPEDNAIRPGDELYIRVSSSDEEQTSFETGRQQIYDPTLISYTVDEDGMVKLPYIGRTKVSEYTLIQASDSIESKLSQYLYYPSVFIRFVNNKVTLLGEVNNPGVYVFNYKNINILQAVGYAGDITEFGDRERVLLIRDDGNVKTKQYIDLTSDDLLASEWYLLKTNDIIYIEPMKRKRWGMREVPYNLILSVISTAIVIMTFVNTN